MIKGRLHAMISLCRNLNPQQKQGHQQQSKLAQLRLTLGIVESNKENVAISNLQQQNQLVLMNELELEI
jgi:hypothetical protein